MSTNFRLDLGRLICIAGGWHFSAACSLITNFDDHSDFGVAGSSGTRVDGRAGGNGKDAIPQVAGGTNDATGSSGSAGTGGMISSTGGATSVGSGAVGEIEVTRSNDPGQATGGTGPTETAPPLNGGTTAATATSSLANTIGGAGGVYGNSAGASGTSTSTTAAGASAQCVPGSAQNCVLGQLRGRQTCTVEGQPGVCTPLVSYGLRHGCLVTAIGNVKCWGDNESGRVGQPESRDLWAYPTPIAVAVSPDGLTENVISISAGQEHSCAVVSLDVSTTRTVCWGANDGGQLGALTPIRSSTPMVIPELPDAVSVHCGTWHTCVKTMAGRIKCWGANAAAEMGNGGIGGPVTTPAHVGNLTNVLGLDAGQRQTCSISSITNRVLCWGGDYGGESCSNSGIPVQISGVSNAIDVSISTAACAVDSSGGVSCWGGNSSSFGETPNTCRGQEVVRTVSLSEPAARVSVDDYTACIVTRGGAAKCWGRNTSYGLGNGDETRETYTDVPQQVYGLEKDVVMLDNGVGESAACAVKTDGSLWCWGYPRPALGISDMSIDHSSIPVQVAFTP